MCWRTASGLRPTSYPATCARPEVGLSKPQSMRIVVDLPAPFGPRKPKTSPLVTARLSRSTATKSPNRLTRFSTTTEFTGTGFAGSGMARCSDWPGCRHGIHKEIFDGRSYLLDGVEGHAGAL